MKKPNSKYFVYAISSEVRAYIYVGMTNNLDRKKEKYLKSGIGKEFLKSLNK